MLISCIDMHNPFDHFCFVKCGDARKGSSRFILRSALAIVSLWPSSRSAVLPSSQNFVPATNCRQRVRQCSQAFECHMLHTLPLRLPPDLRFLFSNPLFFFLPSRVSSGLIPFMLHPLQLSHTRLALHRSSESVKSSKSERAEWSSTARS